MKIEPAAPGLEAMDKLHDYKITHAIRSAQEIADRPDRTPKDSREIVAHLSLATDLILRDGRGNPERVLRDVAHYYPAVAEVADGMK